MKQAMSVLVSSENDSWISPPDIIEDVRYVLGEIDLDPASSKKANTIVKANKIYTIADDMLKQNFSCQTAYMNPPFGKIKNKSQAGVFSLYMINQYSLGRIKQGGIILLMSRFGYNWFEQLLDMTVSATLKDRIRFIHPDTMKQGAQAKTAQTLLCFGNDTIVNRFHERFENTARIHVPKLYKERPTISDILALKDSSVEFYQENSVNRPKDIYT